MDGQSAARRFWDKVDRGDDDECWEWQVALDGRGYGQFSIDGYPEKAHRVSYKLVKEDPDGCVLHHCDNPRCVNPRHLYIGDRKKNAQDAVKRGRMRDGEEHGQSKLSRDEVSKIKWKVENTNMTYSEIADQYEIDKSNITYIMDGKTWSGVPAVKPEGV